MLKFVMTVDDCFCRLKGRMMPHDGFSASGFAKNVLKQKMAIAVLPSAKSARIKLAKKVEITALLG